jgi:hypothetical protein
MSGRKRQRHDRDEQPVAGTSANPILLDTPPRKQKGKRKGKASAAAHRIEESDLYTGLDSVPTFSTVVHQASKPHAYNDNVPGPSMVVPSSQPDCPPLAKKQRRKKDPDAPVEEKRLERYRKSCAKNVMERVDRVMSQRCMLSRSG